MTLFAVLRYRLAGGQRPHLPLHELPGQTPHEVKYAGIPRMMFTEGLEIPGQGDKITPRIPQPVRIPISHQRITPPPLIGEAITHIVTQLIVPRQQHQTLPFMVKMSRLAPLHHPGPSVKKGTAEANAIQGMIDSIGHKHLCGVGHLRPLAHDLLQVIAGPGHPPGEGRHIQERQKAVVGLNVHQFHGRLGCQLAEKLKQLSIPGLRLPEEGYREPYRELHPLFGKVEEHLSSRIVAPGRYLVEIRLIHCLIEETILNISRGGTRWNRLCRKLQTPGLVHNSIDHQVFCHDLPSLSYTLLQHCWQQFRWQLGWYEVCHTGLRLPLEGSLHPGLVL